MNHAYLDTVFDLEPQLNTPRSFVVITAYNPRGQFAPPSRNRHQDQTLRAVLEGRGGAPFRVTGRSVDGKHQEPGWGAVIDIQTGIEIGRMFKQEAIYYIDEDDLSLHSCDQVEVKHLGSWAARVNLSSSDEPQRDSE
jgi:hypothetical protein